MKKIKKWLFPFTKTQDKLKKHWWHRVLVVLFFIVVAITPYQLTMTAYHNSFTPLFNCKDYADNNFRARDYNDASVAKWEVERAQCEDTYAISYKIFFVYGAIAYIIFFYGLQALYFLVFVKLVSYIVRGGKDID